MCMPDNKPVKKINKRSFTFFGGIAFCLFAVTLILNVGYIARAVAFPFVFSFGIGSYAIYILIYAYGLFLFFREKGFRIRLNNYFFGILLMFIGALMLATLITTSGITLGLKDVVNEEGTKVVTGFQNFYLNDVLKNINGVPGQDYWYPNPVFINLFQGNKFGGGYVGYALVALCTTGLKTTGAWVITIFVLLIGAFVIFAPSIINLFTKNKKHKSEEAEERGSNKQQPRVQNYNSLRNANNIQETNISIAATGESAPINQPADFSQRRAVPAAPVSQLSSYGGASFEHARFEKYQTRTSPSLNRQNIETKTIFDNVEPEPAVIEQPQPPVMEIEFEKPAPAPAPAPAPRVVEPAPAPAPAVPDAAEKNKIETPEIVKPPKPKKIKWVAPSTELLLNPDYSEASDLNNAQAEEKMVKINAAFQEFGVGAVCNTYVVGPSVTCFNIEYTNAVSIKSVSKMIDDLALRLDGAMVRFSEIVEGHSYSGLEIPNKKNTPVSFKEVFESLPDPKKHPLAVAFGKNIESKIVSADFDEFPHVLVAGTTGSGKSVFTHSVVATLIMRNSPEDLKLVLIDPKRVEMNKYKDMPHLLCPIINDANIANLTLLKLVDEMNRRYEILDSYGVSNVQEYNKLRAEKPELEKMPFIIVIIDEYADLIDSCKDFRKPVQSLGQKSRACGIHMLISTQRPSANVIDGVIKGNLPTRVALAVASYQDSTVIVNEGGAEKLLGKGDMLVMSPLVSRNGLTRLQSCFIQNQEIFHIVGYLKQNYEPNYDPNYTNIVDESAKAAAATIGTPEFQSNMENSEEAKYQDVKKWVMENEYMSMSRIQRECAVGFNRAGRFFKRLQDEGVVATTVEGNKGCPVLIKDKFYEGSAATDIPVSIDQTD